MLELFLLSWSLTVASTAQLDVHNFRLFIVDVSKWNIFSTEVNVKSAARCRALCLRSYECQSFAYSLTDETCQLGQGVSEDALANTGLEVYVLSSSGVAMPNLDLSNYLCGQYPTVLTVDRENPVTIKSDNYGTGSYYDNTCQEWVIGGPLKTTITIAFEDDFYLEEETDCDFDWIIMADGYDQLNYPATNKYCGRYNNTLVYTTTKNALYIIFETDSSVIETGFSANITVTGS